MVFFAELKLFNVHLLCFQVHKELQDTMAQLDAIRHEIRSISVINPGPLTRRLVDNIDLKSVSGGIIRIKFFGILLDVLNFYRHGC